MRWGAGLAPTGNVCGFGFSVQILQVPGTKFPGLWSADHKSCRHTRQQIRVFFVLEHIKQTRAWPEHTARSALCRSLGSRQGLQSLHGPQGPRAHSATDWAWNPSRCIRCVLCNMHLPQGTQSHQTVMVTQSRAQFLPFQPPQQARRGEARVTLTV